MCIPISARLAPRPGVARRRVRLAPFDPYPFLFFFSNEGAGTTAKRGAPSAPPAGAPPPVMASGFGVKGARGRCHAFWIDFSACMSEADTPASCAALREDYLECLHHRKEARARADA